MYPFFALKAPLVLYPFRYFDPLRRRWIRARYVAQRHEIESRYAQWEIAGAPEFRSRGDPQYFNPFGRSVHIPGKPVKEPPPKEPPREEPPPKEPTVKEPPLENGPQIDALERFLVLLFLRRYVTWCARTRRFAQMQGAAR